MVRGWWTWLGLSGSILLAISAWLAGALPSGDPGDGFRTGGFGAVPTSFGFGLFCWIIGLTVLAFAWIKAPDVGWGIGALWALPLLAAPPLGSRDAYAYACQGWLWVHGVDPYAVGVSAGGCPWAASVPELWQQTPTPYGPLAVALSGLGAAAGSQIGAIIAIRVMAVLAAVLLAWQLPRLAVHCGVSAQWARRLGVITPLVLVHGLSGGHNDVIVAALVVTALATAAHLAAEQGAGKQGSAELDNASGWWMAAYAGALIAAAVAVKVTAIVALPFLLLLMGRRWIAAAATAIATFAGISLASGLGLGWVAALRGTGELAQWSSVPTAIGMTAGYLLRPFGIPDSTPITVARVIGVVALAVIAIWLLRRAWQKRDRTREVIVACGLLLAATTLLGPVFYPWYAIVPLAVLATCVAHKHRRALVIATVICTALTLPNGLGVPVLTKAIGAVAVTAAVIALLIRTRRPAPDA